MPRCILMCASLFNTHAVTSEEGTKGRSGQAARKVLMELCDPMPVPSPESQETHAGNGFTQHHRNASSQKTESDQISAACIL